LKTKDPELKVQVERVLQEIKHFDPEFGKGVFGAENP
jgi:hypothetical protein